ncbi:MAG: hypothetical protein KGQ58_07070 [Proteobacteria bacterium]|nr:hypothetical protein [Pseudomonadota bacterium]MDE3207288.1 hypothetical protein [Pseudomonadota bacterium]
MIPAYLEQLLMTRQHKTWLPAILLALLAFPAWAGFLTQDNTPHVLNDPASFLDTAMIIHKNPDWATRNPTQPENQGRYQKTGRNRPSHHFHDKSQETARHDF